MPNPQGLVMSNSQNQTNGKHIHNYSTFNKSLSYRNYNTHRFGEITPTFVMEGVERDSISVNSADKIDSLSLAAPFKGSIRKIKESFKIPLSAILPRQWDRIYTQPSNGDDVPSATYLTPNCVIKDPSQVVFDEALHDFEYITTLGKYQYIGPYALKTLIMMEYFFSNGSLLSSMGCHLGFRFSYDGKTFDQYFDAAVHDAFKYVKTITCNPYDYFPSYDKGSRALNFYGLSPEIDHNHVNDTAYGSFRSFLDYVRSNPGVSITVETDGNVPDDNESASLFNEWKSLYDLNNGKAKLVSMIMNSEIDDQSTTDINLSRVLAYQIACAHFYTNSSIDPIYSAELYRQYIESLAHQINSNDGDYLFLINGFSNRYDALSGRVLMMSTFWQTNGSVNPYAFSSDLGQGPGLQKLRVKYALLGAIFGYRRSLRYADYFVGCRPRPLAPINTDVSVASNKVSVIDITRNIQAQRFANSVMRSRSKVEEYVKGLFGKAPAPDYHNPFFLSREEEVIFGEEVQNTGAAQTSAANSRTGLFGNNMGRYTFTFDNDDMHPCIYLQVVHYDCKRAYTRSIDRQYFIKDRFDMFNPDYQYIGDQPVFGAELGAVQSAISSQGVSSQSIVETFGYQGRDMEYKQRFDVASGGFIDNLPGWIFDDKTLHANSYAWLIGPEFIRSQNAELDKFFLSLTGYSLGSYFHFICITDNNVDARRAMAVDPQILA